MDISAYQHMNIRMSTRGKRPLRNLTPNDKVRAIQRIHNGETKASVSRDIGVPESTLRGWCKNEEKLRFMCRQIATDNIGDHHGNFPPTEKRIKYDHSIDSVNFQSNQNMKNSAHRKFEVNSKDYIDRSSFENKYDFSCRDSIPLPVSTLFATNLPSLDCTQLPLLPNISFMSLLNQNFINMDKKNSTAFENFKAESNTTNSYNTQHIIENEGNCNQFINLSKFNNDRVVLTEKQQNISVEENDTNNNDLISETLEQISGKEDTVNSTFPRETVPYENKSTSTLLEWCKMFNASINFLALAAAAASLQNTTKYPGKVFKHSRNSNEQQNHKAFLDPVSAIFLTSNNIPSMNTENNNYSLESEPEDLSVRCTASNSSS